ncbi:MAG: hypothetical protein K2Y56_07650 [Methylobacterium sp.]|uniref:hypothetical protein n=1 Tax=Methylobacterium sp. TaxID=409 RepID=UPI0025F78B97|nr:hypothetical protein [Methylobacterium sp.]MBX9931398.1 hypothetical protein [Methylobacterium sp.]
MSSSPTARGSESSSRTYAIRRSGTGLPDFPKDRYDQPLAVEALLRAAAKPMAPAEVARGFKRGGKRIEARVTQSLGRLALYGRIVETDDGRYVALRAA